MSKTEHRIIGAFMMTLMLFFWIATGGLAYLIIKFVLMDLGFISKH